MDLFGINLATAYPWIAFTVIVGAIMIYDLGFNTKDHVVSPLECGIKTIIFMLIALSFGGYVWYDKGAESGMQFITGYVIEMTLSLDNIFVIALILTYFNVEEKLRHRVLFWGILGAIILRGIMIAAGTALVSEFRWVLYLFGAFLVYTAFKMLMANGDEAPDISQNKTIKIVRKFFKVSDEFDGNKFFTKKNGVRYATPLFVALIMIEFADLMFAVDSIPAIFAITTDPFIVYTSNIFAIMGLRSMFFALSAMLHRFEYLKYSLSIVLAFIGVKLLLLEFYHIPTIISLTVPVTLILGGIVYSLYKTRTTA